VGTTLYPVGYAVPIRHWLVEGGDHYVDLYGGDQFWQRIHTTLKEFYREIRTLEKAAKNEERAAAAQLNEVKQLSCLSFGKYKLEDLKYCDLRNLMRTAPCDQFFGGIIKKYYFWGIFVLLGPTAGAALFCRHDEWKQVRI